MRGVKTFLKLIDKIANADQSFRDTYIKTHGSHVCFKIVKSFQMKSKIHSKSGSS